MTEHDAVADSDLDPPPAEPTSTPMSRAHLLFFTSMVVLALIVTITAVSLHANNDPSSGFAQQCDHIDFNIGLDWDNCGQQLSCDAEDGFVDASLRCCPDGPNHVVIERADGDRAVDMILCCEPPPANDPRGGLFDAETEFAERRTPGC